VANVRAHPALALYRTGVVHQHVEWWMTRGVRGHKCLDGRSTRNVDLKDVHMTRARPRRDVARHGVPLCLVTAGEHKARTERTQGDRNLPSDSRGRPGDDHVLPCDRVHRAKAFGFGLLALGSWL